MKVAFATTDGVNVNEHFGRAGKFAVYEITQSGYSRIDDVVFSEGGPDAAVEATRGMGAEHESRVNAKVDRLADCKLIYMQEIGGPSAARLSQKGIMPMKVKEIVTIEGNLERLFQTITQGNTPLWLRRALDKK